MTIPDGVRRFLVERKVPYQVIPHPRVESLVQAARLNGVRPAWLIRVVLLRDTTGFVMAVLPASHMLDFAKIKEQLGRELKPILPGEADGAFTGCEPGSHPPLPELFGLPAIIDESVQRPSEIFFEGGNHESLVAIAGKAFKRLHPDANVDQFARPITDLANSSPGKHETLQEAAEHLAPTNAQARADSTPEIPNLPSLAHALLEMRDEPATTADDLIHVLDEEPEIAVEVVEWARSPLHGGHDAIHTVRDAIVRGMGFDLVLNLSLGIAVSRAFRVPPDGPLGRQTFWRQSVYCASLVHGLARLMPRASRPKTELAYLAGLTHNFGRLLLGHAFPAEHFLVNQYVACNPKVPVSEVERQVMGVDHEYIGGWLMDVWGMPTSVSTSVRWHHNEGYRGDYASYANLVLIANRLLRRINLGDEIHAELPRTLLRRLHLTERLAAAVLDGLLANSVIINRLSNRLAA